MARIKYREVNLKPERAALVVKMNEILAEYDGARVTVRQLYYRLVAKGIIPNTPKEYGKIQNLITDARYAGLIDWDAIEDRTRAPQSEKDWPSGAAVLAGAASGFRLDRWAGQPFHVELWVEKAALAGVLWPIASDFHVTLMVNRGYSSASAMKESADRIRAAIRAESRPRPVVLYLGDHDPSGEDMVRDVYCRLVEFGCPDWLDVRKVALTWDQIEEYQPPPNPVKLTDARASAYIEKYGEHSWEVDALPPPVLNVLVRRTVAAYVDKEKMDAVVTKENLIKAQIKKLAQGFSEV